MKSYKHTQITNSNQNKFGTCICMVPDPTSCSGPQTKSLPYSILSMYMHPNAFVGTLYPVIYTIKRTMAILIRHCPMTDRYHKPWCMRHGERLTCSRGIRPVNCLDLSFQTRISALMGQSGGGSISWTIAN